MTFEDIANIRENNKNSKKIIDYEFKYLLPQNNFALN
jgi:hypothetical protein